jgi:hypothetical protein
MNYDYSQTDFSRGILSGLFSGLVACVANALFVLVYRAMTSFYEFNGVDVTVIVFGSIMQLLVCGWLFYLFVHYLRKGISFYRLVVICITVLIFFLGLIIRRSVMGSSPDEFKIMVVGTQVIIGTLAAFFIPYLFRHDSLIS